MTTPVLYILMRNDLPSMNPGKAMAQASHASNACVDRVARFCQQDEYIKGLYNTWKSQTTQGFGTVLVLSATLDQIKAVGESDRPGVLFDKVVDPTYPYLLDNETAALIPDGVDTAPRAVAGLGKMVLFRREVTCAYVFGDKEDSAVRLMLDNLGLHP